MECSDISNLREAANSYLFLLQHYDWGYTEPNNESVTRLVRAIANVDLGKMGEVLAQHNVNQNRIIEELVEPTLKIIGDLEKEIGDNMPTIIKNIDPEASKVFKFCKDLSNMLRCEYEKLKLRRITDPTFADIEAVEKLRLFGLGYYGDLTFDDFIKEYIIKDEPHIVVLRRLKYIISQCTDEQMKMGLSKFLYWRKCDEDAIGELNGAFDNFIKFYDHAADLSPITSEGNRDEVTTRMFSVLEWCKQYDKELKTQMVNRPLLKDVEDLSVLATYICKSFDNWSSVIGNDSVTLELFNSVAYILDNVIVPTIKQRNPTSPKQEPNPKPQLTPSVEATTKDDVPLLDLMLLDKDEQKQKLLDVLHKLIDGKKGKHVALVLLVCEKCGLMNKPTHQILSLAFGGIGTKSGYNKYYSKGLVAYTQEQIKGIETHILPFINGH